jgi:bifunctional DNA-binding transcriptional regulator/antitoxin component of YhaV-PrlF toxin-antitoxin module
MTNIKYREKFRRLDSQIWKKTKVDAKGRIVLPKKLRKKLGLNGHSSILWISAKRKDGKDNEFLIEVGAER